MKFKGKEVKVVLSEEATDEYNELNRIVGDELQRGVTSSVHQSIFRSVERVKGWLKENPFVGEQVQKSLIPDYYLKKYGITNLWRIDLSDYWRLVYTIQSNEVEIIDFVLNIVDHKKYDKIFGYKEK
jgi:mRNA-degrading endonuclease RelE of RelBE toxin-antitoxin system